MQVPRNRWRRGLAPISVVAAVGGFSGLVTLAAPAASAATCADTGVAGLSAARVASAGAHISGPVDATGCDLGVFVGPGASGATISHATITGANDHGILVLDASHVTISHDVVEGNGIAPHAMTEDKAIDLVGTTDSSVVGNVVEGNEADGGIALNDDGPFDAAIPGGPGNSIAPLRASTGNVVAGNTVAGNAVGCGIVLSSYNPGAGVVGNTVVHNKLLGKAGTFPPVVGSIVLAGQLVRDNQIVNNTITGSGMPGIILHSNTPAESLVDNSLVHNTLVDDDWLRINGPDARVGILLGGAEPGSMAVGELSGTRIVANRISNEEIGIYLNLQPADGRRTKLAGNHFGDVATPVQR